MGVIKKVLLVILGISATNMCLGGIFSLFILLRYADFQKGKAVVIVLFLLIIVGFGLVAFKCFKTVFRKKRVPLQECKPIYFPVEEMQVPSALETFVQPAKKEAAKREDEPVPVVKVNIAHQEAPQEVLHGMRMAFTGQQAVNDMRIIDESLAIMEKTTDIDTFLQRYETTMRCALTLEQAKKAGVIITLPDGFSQSLANIKGKVLEGVLYRSFQKELGEINKLKTDKGRLNRINKYQEKLKGMYEDVFEFVAEDAYNDVMKNLELLKKE